MVTNAIIILKKFDIKGEEIVILTTINSIYSKSFEN